MNFRYKLAQFMAGRYGFDTLFYLLLGTAVTLAVTNIFIGSSIIQISITLIEVFAVYRVFSRNYNARSKENQFVCGFVNNIINKIHEKKAQKADLSHIYKKCPQCHATLRLPRRPGKHETVCPNCNCKFKVNVR